MSEKTAEVTETFKRQSIGEMAVLAGLCLYRPSLSPWIAGYALIVTLSAWSQISKPTAVMLTLAVAASAYLTFGR